MSDDLSNDLVDEYGDDMGTEWVPADRAGEAGALWDAEQRLARIRFWQARLAAELAVFDRRATQLAKARETVEDRYRARIDHHRVALTQIHAALLRTDPKRTRVILPSGTMTARVPKVPNVDIVDEAAFVLWADGRTDGVVTVTQPAPSVRPSKATIKKVFEVGPEVAGMPDCFQLVDPATGEVVPGVVGVLSTTFTVTGPDEATDL